MRPEILYLTDIVEAADAIGRFLNDVEKEDFLRDELRQSAVLQKLTVIGEAAARLSEEFRKRYPTVPWPRVIGLRNVAVHEYFSVNWEIIWVTATSNVPLLREQVAAMLAAAKAADSESDSSASQSA